MTVNYKKTHSEKLLTAIHHLLEDVGLTIREMDAFGVVAGPGSFTGLRIGMATAKGFAQALDKPMVTVSTLEALAYNINYVSGLICPILDAQRNQVYTALYRAGGDGHLETLSEDRALGIADLLALLKKHDDQKIYLLGDATDRFAGQIQEVLGQCYVVDRHHVINRAGSAGLLAHRKLLEGKTCTYDRAALSYLRPSYAEEKRHES